MRSDVLERLQVLEEQLSAIESTARAVEGEFKSSNQVRGVGGMGEKKKGERKGRRGKNVKGGEIYRERRRGGWRKSISSHGTL